MPAQPNYRGRFAPSPTGPLHFGSLVAAVASYADALANGGEWLVRVEDLDPTRTEPGATDCILESLTQHGFVFAEPARQSLRSEVYQAALDKLLANQRAYPCSCTRKTLLATARRGIAGIVYPGTCREQPAPPESNAVRLRCTPARIEFRDGLQGLQQMDLKRDVGDFLLRRGDRYFAYQLAVAVDDHAQGITHVLRGTDLITSTFMQLAVLDALELGAPQYAHFAVVLGPDGRKLSKQNKSPAIDNKNNKNNIMEALSYLNHEPPKLMKTAQLSDIWFWVQKNWTLSKLCALRYSPDKGYDKD